MKKVVKALMTSIVAFTLTLSVVFALPSQTANGEVVHFTVNGEVRDDIHVTFKSVTEYKFDDLNETVLEEVNRLNAGENLLSTITGETIADNGLDLNEFSLLTKVEDLVSYWISDRSDVGATNVQATWEVPNLSSDLGEVYVLHYSIIRGLWEILTSDNIDYNARTITATFQDLSPVAVIYRKTKSDTPTYEESPDSTVNTGDKTKSMVVYAGIAVVALMAGGYVVYRMRKEESK